MSLSSAWAQPDSVQDMTMLGTYYSNRFVGRKTAGGEIFRQNQYTAAHKSLPLGTFLLVTCPQTEKQIIVRVNDRCPKPNVLDMTKLGCYQLGIKGSRKVSVRILAEDVEPQWRQQDTLAINEEDYLAFRDKNTSKPYTPYARRTSSASTPSTKPVPNQKSPSATDSQQQQRRKPQSQPQRESDFAINDAGTIKIQPNPSDPFAPQPTVSNVDTVSSDSAYHSHIIKRCYNLELCKVSSQRAAQQEIKRLPAYLQSKVSCQQGYPKGSIRLVLMVSESHSKIIRTQEMLKDSFPESTIIESGQK